MSKTAYAFVALMLAGPKLAQADNVFGTLRDTTIFSGASVTFPIAAIRVELWSCTPNIFGCPWAPVVATTTDELGSFSFLALSFGSASWQLRAYTSNDAAVMREGGAEQHVEINTSAVTGPPGSRVMTFNQTLNDPRFVALGLFHSARQLVLASRDPRETDVLPRVNADYFSTGGLAPPPGYAPGSDTINVNTYYDAVSWTVGHAYAHFVARHIGTLGPVSEGSNLCTSRSAELAWTEGFAEFFNHRVLDLTPVFGGNHPSTPFNYCVPALPGPGVGENISTILYQAQRLRGGNQPIIELLDRELGSLGRAPTLSDFYEAWLHRGLDRVDLNAVFTQNYVVPRATTFIPGFDTDARADLTVFRPSNGTWYLISSASQAVTVAPFGASGDVPVPGDYDGDQRTDLALWKPSTAQWLIQKTSLEGFVTIRQWGVSSDVPTPGDFDGDGRTDFAVWRPTNGTWYIIDSTTGIARTIVWGVGGDLPVAGDYDCDGKTDVAIWRPSSAAFWILNSRDGSIRIQSLASGNYSAARPIPADYDGDRCVDPAYWHPANGLVWIAMSTSRTVVSELLGAAFSDVILPRDYNGDGTVDLAYWRPSTGIWTIYSAPTWVLGTTPRIVQWGLNGDVPVPSK